MKDVEFEFGRSPAVNPGMSERWKMVSIIEELCLTVNSVSSYRSGAKIRKGYKTMSRGSLMIDADETTNKIKVGFINKISD